MGVGNDGPQKNMVGWRVAGFFGFSGAPHYLWRTLYFVGRNTLTLTMQEKAMELMGKKLLAAEALEGKFSSEGLVAMAGDDGIEMAMARSLAENMDDSSDRSWQQALDDGDQRRTRARARQRHELVVIE